MVLKFQDYIKEGLWKSGVNRAKNGDIRREDIPQPIELWGRTVYELKDYPGYYISIAWRRKDNFKPKVYLYHESEEDDPAGFYEGIKSNGIDKRFEFGAVEYEYIDLDATYNYDADPYTHEFKESIRKLLDLLPDSAFERVGLKYDFDHLGYPVEGFDGWYIDFKWNGWADNNFSIKHFTNDKRCGYCINEWNSKEGTGGIQWNYNIFKIRHDNIFKETLINSAGGRFENGVRYRPMTDDEIEIILSTDFLNGAMDTFDQIGKDDCDNE